MRAPIAAEAHIDRPLARTVGSTIFISRWLQAPLYLGLIAAQGVYVWRFMQELWHLVTDLPKGYRDHFSRLAEPEGTVGVAAPDAEAAQKSLSAYTALDTIVVRGLASAKVDPMTTLAEAAAP